MNIRLLYFLILQIVAFPTLAQSGNHYHVSVTGNNSYPGTEKASFKTITAAANIAKAGDTITVHQGIYRERVNPPHSGASDDKRIAYQAAKGEKVIIKGSEIVKGWEQVRENVWKVSLPNSFFGDFNPYQDTIWGDWFISKGRRHHTGAVYLDGHWLSEAATLKDVMDSQGTPQWYAESNNSQGGITTIWANFSDVDPNKAEVEINVRQTVFYPDQPGVNYLTVRGFVLEQAATPWAPPTAEQIGLIGTHWSKGWIIENNVIRYSSCVGLTLGKYGDKWDNTSENSAEGYVNTIERALERGWSGEIVGHHTVRNNIISHCEQAGIVGSLGAVFSRIIGNEIYDIHQNRQFSGHEMAGIKIHAAIDTEIRNNHIYNTYRGIWLDWMTQGTRVSGNLLHGNGTAEDLFVEVNHGPYLVDNNIFLSPKSLLVNSQGGAYVHNLFAGELRVLKNEKRKTPFQLAHSTEMGGLSNNLGGDERYYNNLFFEKPDLSQYAGVKLPVTMDGNIYLNGAKSGKFESAPIIERRSNTVVDLIASSDGYFLDLQLNKKWAKQQKRDLITSTILGKALTPDLLFEQSDGQPYFIDQDYFGNRRKSENPFPGPFIFPGKKRKVIKIWPHESDKW